MNAYGKEFTLYQFFHYNIHGLGFLPHAPSAGRRSRDGLPDLIKAVRFNIIVGWRFGVSV